jgi:hypothetical protein
VIPKPSLLFGTLSAGYFGEDHLAVNPIIRRKNLLYGSGERENERFQNIEALRIFVVSVQRKDRWRMEVCAAPATHFGHS